MDYIIEQFANNERRRTVRTLNFRRPANKDERVTSFRQATDTLAAEKKARNKASISGTPETASNVETADASLLDVPKYSQRGTLKHADYGTRHPKRNFGAKARHLLLEAGSIVDRTVGKNAWILTVTIPGSTPEAHAAVADWSGWIALRMTQVIRRSAIGKEAVWFYVNELQDRGALHQHWCIGHPDNRAAKQLTHELEYEWFECLLELKDKCGVDCFRKDDQWTWRDKPHEWQSDVQQVKKSVAAYFAKYASKEAKNQKALAKWKKLDLHYPARWWGSSQSIKDGIKAWRRKYEVGGFDTEREVEIFDEELEKKIGGSHWKKKYESEFAINVPFLSVPICHGKVEVRYCDPDEWPRIHAELDSLTKTNKQLGLSEDDEDKSTFLSRLVDYAKKKAKEEAKAARIAEWKEAVTRWRARREAPRTPPPIFTSPFTGEVFQTWRDVELETAKLQLAREEEYMKTSGYAEQLNLLQKLAHHCGWADRNNPYLIEQKRIDMLIDDANYCMDYLLWLETPFEEKLAAFQEVSSMHPCNNSPVSNNLVKRPVNEMRNSHVQKRRFKLCNS